MPSGEDRRFSRAELDQRAQGGAGRRFARASKAAGEQEGDDDCSDLEIDLAGRPDGWSHELERHLHPRRAGVEEENATTDQPQAASVPREINVSIVAAT